MKKITSFILALALVFSLVPVPAFGQEAGPGVSIVAIDGNRVAADYSTSVPAYLVAAIFTEDGSKMLGSGRNVVSPEYHTGWVETNVSEMPSNFLVRVFLLDLTSKAPLCEKSEKAFSRDRENITWKLAEDGTLTISGTGEMEDYDYVTVSPPWADVASQVKKVIIENGITSIGKNAFSSCSRLTEAVIPSSVTHIGDYAFLGCSDLSKATIPNGVAYIGNQAFYRCSSLTDVTIPNSVTHLCGAAFSGCKSLTSVTIPNSVTYLGSSVFSDCSNLASVTLSNNVTSLIGEVFRGCTSLSSVTIPDGVTSIGARVFDGCVGLTNVTIPNNVTEIGWEAFNNCTSLSDVYYTGTMEQWGQISIVYDGNDPLSSAVIHCIDGDIAPASAAMANAVLSIAEELPADSDTETVNEPAPEAAEEISGSSSGIAGEYGEGLTWALDETGTLTISGNGTMADYSPTSPAPWSGQQAQIRYITIQSGALSIGSHAFENCASVTTVTIPISVTAIGEYAFSGCAQLSDVYYGGTMEQWQQFGIDCGNAAIHCADGDFSPIDATIADDVPDETEPVTEPITEPVTEPVTEPITEPATESATEPVTEPATELATEPASEPAAESEPVAEPTPAPETEPEAAPVEEASTAEPLSNIQWFSVPEGATMTTLPVLQPLSVFTGTEGTSGNARSVKFTGLKPGAECVLIVSTVPGSLEPQDLMYIDQNNAATDGSLSFNYIPREDVEAIVELYSVPNEQNADVNSDGKIDVDNVFYLAMYISAPDMFPIAWVSADVNSDGSVNVDDVFYLAMHISAPALFPLFPQPSQAL